MTVSTANIVSPVLTTTEVIALFPSSVTGQACLGDCLRTLVLKRNNLGRVTLFNMRLAGTVTGFATGNVVLPTSNFGELRV